MTTAVLVALAAAAGACARYWTDETIQARSGGVAFPWGTFTVNAVGSLLLGLLVGLASRHGLTPTARTVIGTGFTGGLTTFSTWSWETIRLVGDGAWRAAAGNVLASVVVGLTCATLGLAVTGAL